MTHFLGNDLEDTEYLIHILFKLNKSIKSKKKKTTYNDAALYPHVHLFIQPDLDSWALGMRDKGKKDII